MPSPLVVGCALLFTAFAVAVDPAKADSEKMQGQWRWLPQKVPINNSAPQLLGLIQGRDRDKEELVGEQFTLEVKGNRFTFFDHKKKAREATAKLDAGKNPRAIDLAVGKGTLSPGIYKVEGEPLTLCVGDQ